MQCVLNQVIMIDDLIIYTPMYITFFWGVVLLLSYRHKNKAKYFLGFFMITASILYLSHAIFFNRYNDLYLFFDPIYTLASLSVYPLYYWYIKLLTVELDYYFKNLRMLIPAVFLSLLMFTVYFLMSPQERNDYVNGFLFSGKDEINETMLFKVQKGIYLVCRIVFTVQVVWFVLSGSRLVVKHNKRVANFYSNLESKTIVWVNLLFLSFVITSLMSIVFNLIGKVAFFNSVFLLLIPSVIFSALLFMIGYQGYMQNHTVADLINDEKQEPVLELKALNQNRLKECLTSLFEKEQIYKQSDLKITQVSAILNTNRTYVSNLINIDFSCSFSEFVNKYRIVEAKKILLDKTAQNYSLEHVSELVGFGSLHTFIRVFKKSEGITPGRYRDKNRIEN